MTCRITSSCVRVVSKGQWWPAEWSSLLLSLHSSILHDQLGTHVSVTESGPNLTLRSQSERHMQQNGSLNMVSPQTSLLLSSYTKCTTNLYFLGTIRTRSSASPPLPGGELGQTDRRVAITNTVPPNRLSLVRMRGAFCLPGLGVWTTFILLLRDWHLGMKTRKQ